MIEVKVNVQQNAGPSTSRAPMWSAWTTDERFPVSQRARVGVSMSEALSNLKYALRKHMGKPVELIITRLPRRKLNHF